MIEIITTMIKTKFSFFQVQIKGALRHVIEFCQTALGKTSERFDTVNMPLTTGKFIVTMMYPEVLIKANIDQSVIARAIHQNGSRYLVLHDHG